MIGASVLGGIALAVAIMILDKGRSDIPKEVPTYTQSVRVIDGDTIEVNSEKIRLYGIDAPEKGNIGLHDSFPVRCAPA